MVVNTKELRQINKELVLNFLRNNKYGTKNKISKTTGLSISTCRNILNDLLSTGEILEESKTDSNGGRPSTQYSFNKNYSFVGVLGFSNVGTKQKVVMSVHNLTGEIMSQCYHEFNLINIVIIKDLIRSMLTEWPKVKIISMGIPGIVVDGVVGICDIQSLENIPLKEFIEKDIPIEVILENDVNAAAIGYSQSNKLKDTAYLYYPYLGIPGAGLIINGNILRGANNFAGEVRFLPLGAKFEDLQSIQNNFTKFAEHIIKTILSINSILNPERIAISWKNFTEEQFNTIKKSVHQQSIPGHIPVLTYNTNIDIDYTNGLALLGLKGISCKFKVVESW